RSFNLPRAPVLFEVDLAPLLQRSMPQVRPVSKLPLVPRDIAIAVDERLSAQELLAALSKARPSVVDDIRLFDVYRGPGIAPGKKSLAILVLIQDTERTLTDAEIDTAVGSLLRIAGDRFGGTLRQ